MFLALPPVSPVPTVTAGTTTARTILANHNHFQPHAGARLNPTTTPCCQVTPYVDSIVSISLALMQHDPNVVVSSGAGMEDDEEEVAARRT